MASDEFGTERYAHRFDIGDTIWVLLGDQPHKEFYLCTGCEGEGGFRIETLRHNRVTCPDCHGRGRVWLDSEVRFYTMAERTVGQVQVTVSTVEPYRDDAVEVAPGHWRTVAYMAHETGVGSGNVFYESRCFPTEDDAVAYAEQQGWVSEAVAKTPVEASLTARNDPTDLCVSRGVCTDEEDDGGD